MSPDLLRDVRCEIQNNLSFSPKETDIYKIYQSGDLVNLDGLDDDTLKLFPSLLTLRNELYSSTFREYISKITGSGSLSGKKTDMAINVYTPGCHLLCHDDVIGSRRVSYILYLTDPDCLWKEEWGGALRLYPTKTEVGVDGQKLKIPLPDHAVSIPPAFNQLSFFAVQPGESFHDVEEVFADQTAEGRSDGETRIRTAISGWYHVPQEGETEFLPRLEAEFSEQSSLTQLQGKGGTFDLPAKNIQSFKILNGSSDALNDELKAANPPSEELKFTEEDLNFLLKYITPDYLTPDVLESVSENFGEECAVTLDSFLSPSFSESVIGYIKAQEAQALPLETAEIERNTSWMVARPPHKQRFLFQQVRPSRSGNEESPLQDLLENLFPSDPFRKWLQLVIGEAIVSHDLLLRRFRAGRDYTLATTHEEDEPRLELTLGLTPTIGWEAEDPTDKETEQTTDRKIEETASAEPSAPHHPSAGDFGGYVAYMTGDDTDDKDTDSDATEKNASPGPSSATQARKADPAIYRAPAHGDDDDGILYSLPAGWNHLGIVMRDKGVMKFTKYVSRHAPGDRWDICGEFRIADDDDDPQ